MTAQLTLTLLGPPQFSLDDQPITAFRTAKAQALLAYLAVSGLPHLRSSLVGLLWGEMPEASARKNLTKTLSELRKIAGDHLAIDGQTVAFRRTAPYWLDVEVFRAADGAAEGATDVVEEAELRAAAALIRGDFLEGFSVRNAPEYEFWMLAQRAQLREQAVVLLDGLAQRNHARGDRTQAIAYTRQLLALDGWREEAHRHLMQLLAEDGQRSAALAQYEICRTVLAEELAVEPSPATESLVAAIRDGTAVAASTSVALRRDPVEPDAPEQEALHRALMELYAQNGQRTAALQQYETCRAQLAAELAVEPDAQTQQLYEQILQGKFERRPPVSDVLTPLERVQPPIPALPTAFVAREDELEEIVDRLRDPKCRLLTLLGPGGVGKTYLANQAAIALRSSPLFPDGVYWVDLAGFTTPDAVISAIAEVLGLHFHSDSPELTQLTNQLAGRSLLLVLDNFEHLIDGAISLATLLTRAPSNKLLVTSRVTLQLRGEWLYGVKGMGYPQPAEAVHTTGEERYLDSDAVRLFAQAAARHLNDFDLDQDGPAVVRICRAVEGIPLALELAAAWLRSMSCDTIAQLLAGDSDMLASRTRDAPFRQSSIQAVFDGSWAVLPDLAQQALARLSVLRGRFGPQAAAAVAGVSVFELETLIGHSFVQHLAHEGTYTIHELLRQFATQKLESAPAEATVAYRTHADYFATYLAVRQGAMLGAGQAEALSAINARIDNIRAAWQWSVAQSEWAIVERMMEPLFEFYIIRSRFEEGLAAAQEALTQLPAAAVAVKLLAQLHNRAALCLHYVGDPIQCAAEAASARSLAVQAGDLAEEAYAVRTLGMNAHRQGQFGRAETHLGQSLQLELEAGNQTGAAAAWYMLGLHALDQSEFALAEVRFEECLALSRTLQRTDWIAYALDMLAFLNLNLGEFERSAVYFDEALYLFQSVDDWLGIGKTLGGSDWARLKLGQGDVETVVKQGDRSLRYFEAIGEQAEMASRLFLLAHIQLFDGGAVEAARRYMDRSIRLVPQPPVTADQHRYIAYSGLVAIFEGDTARARRELLTALRYFRRAEDPVACGEILSEIAPLLATGQDLLPHTSRTPGVCRSEAVRWLSSIRTNSPAYGWLYVREWVDATLTTLASELPPEVYTKAAADGQTLSVETVVASLINQTTDHPAA